MPAGRASMQMTLASQGRSASALAGALSGSGSLTLESAASPASIRGRSTSPSAPATMGRRPTTSNFGRSSSRRCRPARCRSRRRKSRSTSRTGGCASARPRSMPKVHAPSCPAVTIFPPIKPIFARFSPRPRRVRPTGRPEIQIFAVGSPDALNRTVDVAALSSWLAVRAIDRETRRLDSIERGEAPPASRIDSTAARALPPDAAAERGRPIPIPGRDPRRLRRAEACRSAPPPRAAASQRARRQSAGCAVAAAD